MLCKIATMKHRIYEIIGIEFKGFVEANYNGLKGMKPDTIVPVTTFLHGTYMRDYPFFVKYIGKIVGEGGHMYVFINDKMDKIYSYQDVG